MTRRSITPTQVRRTLAAGLLVAAACSLRAAPGTESTSVEIRRTVDGIPHLRAHDWRSLGVGIGYVQAQDALCTLAESFVTYEGRRSFYFGADERPARDSTFGRPKNLELDLFFRGITDEDMPARYRGAQATELVSLIDGYAAGYNRWLHEARRGARPRRACVGQPWVRDIQPDDIYRRLYALQIAAGYAHFIPEIVNASPPGDGQSSATATDATLTARLSHPLGTQDGLGSNMMAFGGEATGNDGAVLFGNPHWYWGGPDRFYQMHLTIPGSIDVAGVAMLGVPVVMIGFNRNVAWSHTVSAARRFGLFDVVLAADDPTRYVVDGVAVPMQARQVSMDTRNADGGVTTVSRSLYRTRFGPIVDLGAQSEAFGWRGGHALAIRDVNDENLRVFSNFLAWDRATSLDEFIAIQKREAAMPWVNTVAIGRGDRRVWYADVGAVPNASDALRARCATPRSEAFASADAATPMLDGSRSECGWVTDPATPVLGAMAVASLPSMLRTDEVANMNDSHWLASPDQPLEGYAAVLGAEKQPLSLRSRLGHEMAQSLARRGMRSSTEMRDALLQETLAAHSFPAEHFRGPLIARACEPGTAASDIDAACSLLRRWPGTAEAGDRGALLWDAFWSALQKVPAADFYRVPFASDAAIETPRMPAPSAAQAREALVAAIAILKSEGLSFDAAVGERLRVRHAGRAIALFGGCAEAGYFVVTCLEEGASALGPDTVANSYLQVVRFGAGGVDARTLLAHGQDEDAVEDGSDSPALRRYARKEWLRFPFTEREIGRDATQARTLFVAK